MKKNYRIILNILIVLSLSACQPALWGNSATPTSVKPSPVPSTATQAANTQAAPAAEQPAINPKAVMASAAIPAALQNQLKESGFEVSRVESASQALLMDVGMPIAGGIHTSTWVYALVAPFPTLLDNVSSRELFDFWQGKKQSKFYGRPLLMEEPTLATFSYLWGKPAQGVVTTLPAEALLDAAWNQIPAFAIIPFEQIEPRWKVISIDGQSPIQKSFHQAAYPLKAQYRLTCVKPCNDALNDSNFSFTNYDSRKITTVILTGVTALARATAAKMDVKGITYPGELIRDVLREADVTHINNEVPFYGGCPAPDPNQQKERFCSAPRYIKLLTDVGADVVELSGDHFADYGAEAMLETLRIYEENNLPYYGGGYNIEDGRKPLLMEVNGNKIMFIGCNYKSIYASARENVPGAVKCDFEYMTEQIRKYRAEGYLPISTFQYHEFSSPEARPQQMIDFRRMADAGAVIVSGSQAHVPQAMEFYNGSFIHYGLGNLFFDQMASPKGADFTQREFLDRHVFYEGKYLGVELITAYLTDFSRPRFMTPQERVRFLTDVFKAGGWDFPQIQP